MFEKSEKLKKLLIDRERLINELRHDGLKLKTAPEIMRDDREVVEIAILNNGMALAYASDRLRNDEAIVKQAVMQNGAAIQFAGKYMDDTYMFIMAVKSNQEAYSFGSRRIKENIPMALCM